MVKFAVLFFAALAFQATFAAQVDFYQQNIQQGGKLGMQDLLQQVQSISREVITDIQQAEIQEHSHALYTAANEFAHNIHEIAHELHHVIHHTEEGRSQQLLEHAQNVFSEAVHQLEKAIREQPEELKSQLETQIENVAAQAEKLYQVIKQEQSGSGFVAKEAQDSLDDLLAALQQLKIHNNIEHATREQVKSQIRTVTAKAVNALEDVKTGDENVAEELVHHAHRYGHHLDDIVHHLKKEVRSQHIDDEEAKNVLKKVSDNLDQIRHSLDRVDHEAHETYGQDRHELERAEHQARHKFWLVYASNYPLHYHYHEHEHERMPVGHLERRPQDNYGQYSGLEHHEDKYTKTHGSLGHLEHQPQDNLHKIYKSLKPVNQRPQEIYGQTHGPMDHFGQHAEDNYGQIHQGLHAQDNYGQVHQGLHAQDNYGQVHQGLHAQDYYGQVNGLGRHSDDIYGQTHIYGDDSFQPIRPHFQDVYGQGPIRPVGQYYPGGVRGNQSPVVKHLIEELETGVRGVAAELARLVGLVRPTETKQHGSENVKELIHTVIAHSLVATRQLERNVEHTVHHVKHISQE